MSALLRMIGLACLTGLLVACVVERVCYSDDDCPSHQVCDTSQGLCVTSGSPCVHDSDCPVGFICRREDGQCVPDSIGPLDCPEGMVSIGDAYCMDIYEASRPDATAQDMGREVGRALSRPGVIPWHQKPADAQLLQAFSEACRASGKHLCQREEWFHACAGSQSHTYVFGDVFDREICNCVDTFCDDYCEENQIASCPLGDNCGYTYDSFHVMPTGSFPGCIDEWGVLDLNGNVWELVPSTMDSRGYEVRGGAFNCAGATERLKCAFNASWSELYAGFRCCWRPEDAGGP